MEKMHIVVFTGGESPEPEEVRAYFEAHEPDSVIAADSGLETAERYRAVLGERFAPSVILGDMDSLRDKAALSRYSQDIIQRYPTDKDWSDTELALQAAHDMLTSATGGFITLVGASGGRIDHLLAVFDLFATPMTPDVWLSESQALYHARTGSRFEVTGLAADDMVSVARTTAFRTGGSITSQGLEWEWDCFRAQGMPSLSNRISRAAFEAKKNVTIEVQEGDFVLILPLSAAVNRI